jgi:hypothetical protein
LNSHRRKKHRERMKAVMAAAAAAAKAKPIPPRVPYVPKGAKLAYRPPVKKTTTAKYKGATAKHVASRVTPISRPGAKPIARGLTLIKPSNGVRVKSLVKPVGRSVVILKARPHRPVLNVTKPTVAALPGVETVAKAKDCPTPVVSSIVAMTKPTVESIQVLAPVPIVVVNALIAAPPPVVKPKSSAAVVKACAAAQAALAVNALEVAAKAAMESSAEPKPTPKVVVKEVVPTAVKSDAKPADAAMKKAMSVNSIAVATASAIAAAMVTGTGAAAKPAVTKEDAAKPTVLKEEPIVVKPVATVEAPTAGKPVVATEAPAVAKPVAVKGEPTVANTVVAERIPAPIVVNQPPPTVAPKAQPVTPVTSAAGSEHSDSSCDTSVSKSSTVVAAPLESKVDEAVPDEAKTIEASDAMEAIPIEASIKAETTSEHSPATGSTAPPKDVTPSSQSLQKQAAAVAQPAQFLIDAGIKQESLSTSTGPTQDEETRPAPPRFPEVPSVVKQEASDEDEKKASPPQEVPPV